MTKTITITAPNPGYNGISAGVRFTDGKAEITEKQHAALEYFGRHRFGISESVSTGEEPELKIPATPAPVVEPTDVEGLSKLTRAELDAIAEKRGIDGSGAANKGELAALIAGAAPAVPAALTATEVQAGIVSPNPQAGAGDGPTGPLHNEGRDAANPGGSETTPVDAGI